MDVYSSILSGFGKSEIEDWKFVKNEGENISRKREYVVRYTDIFCKNEPRVLTNIGEIDRITADVGARTSQHTAKSSAE